VRVAGGLVLARVDLAISRVDCGRRGRVATTIPVMVCFIPSLEKPSKGIERKRKRHQIRVNITPDSQSVWEVLGEPIS
jgi:hypothetical protein